MSTVSLHKLDDTELTELIREMEHAEKISHTALAVCPLDSVRLAAACGVCQDAVALLMDAYDESMLRLAAEFDRVFDLGGDNE